MPKPIFDQDRPRSTMAQRLDEAFAGCDEWTVIAAPRRRNAFDFAPIVPSTPQIFDGAHLLRNEEPQLGARGHRGDHAHAQ